MSQVVSFLQVFQKIKPTYTALVITQRHLPCKKVSEVLE